VSLRLYPRRVEGQTLTGRGTDADVTGLITTPLGAAAGLLFGAVSALRRARSLHPKGDTFAATIRLRGAPEHEGLVRYSRSVGLPDRWPDVLGLALRIHAPGGDQDLLMASSASPPFGRHLLVPGRRFAGRTLSSLAPFAVDGRASIISAVPVGEPAPGARVLLRAADPTGEWRDLGEVDVGARLPESEDAALRFSVENTGAGIRPLGAINRLRPPAYRLSQTARP
jgi:hypothetical protein